MRAVLRYRRIPFLLIHQNSPEAAKLPAAKVPLQPTFYLPDETGRIVPTTDSTPLIRRFEQAFEGRSIVPPEPALAFLDELLEDYADEWLTKPTLSDVRRVVIELRRKKSMVLDASDPNRRSCGSFFVNPIVDEITLADVKRRAADPSIPTYPQASGRTKLSAAWLIEHAGFHKGQRFGRVGLSTRHALALVCHQGARSEDVVAAARIVRNGVRRRFGVKLVPEPNFCGFFSLDAGLPDDRLAS
jgi:hypothetical protein